MMVLGTRAAFWLAVLYSAVKLVFGVLRFVCFFIRPCVLFFCGLRSIQRATWLVFLSILRHNNLYYDG